MTETDGPLFSLQNVTVSFGRGEAAGGSAALKNVSLSIRRGEQVAIVGPSGSGKTTLLRLLCAAVQPTAGTIRVDDRLLPELSSKELRAVRGTIGFIHQDLSLVPNIRVIQNVILGRLSRYSLLKSMATLLSPSKATAESVYRFLERVGIPEKLYARTDSLSGGQQQRVAVARALFQEPQALLADEPVSSLDPARAEDLLRLFCEISAEQKLTLLTSLHNVALAKKFFGRLIGLRAGQIVFDLPASEVDEKRLNELFTLEARELLE